jgi:hypothetical protein
MLQIKNQQIAVPSEGSQYSLNSQFEERDLTNEEELYE